MARRVGAYLLREAMTVRAEIDLASYDRLFPAQDFMPAGSFGNLIALPLQGTSRRRGTTIFLDPSTLRPFDDQWAFLSALGRSSPEAIESMAESVRQVAAGPLEPTYRPPRGREMAKAPATIVPPNRTPAAAMRRTFRICPVVKLNQVNCEEKLSSFTSVIG